MRYLHDPNIQNISDIIRKRNWLIGMFWIGKRQIILIAVSLQKFLYSQSQDIMG